MADEPSEYAVLTQSQLPLAMDAGAACDHDAGWVPADAEVPYSILETETDDPADPSMPSRPLMHTGSL